MTQISRREFAALVAASAVARQVADPLTSGQRTSAPSLTANAVILRIKEHIGVDWKPETIDGVKAGDPSTMITGVATTAMATIEVLRQAVKVGANLILTSEPTFYARSDARTHPAGRGAAPGTVAAPSPPDRVFLAKNELIDKNNLVIFRLSDHWRLRRPDPFGQGFAAALGWTKYESASDPTTFVVPSLSLETLAGRLKSDLRARGGMRIVGDPKTPVQRVALLPGSTALQASIKALASVDVVIAGEVREWESVEYARDTVVADLKKGLIMVGRLVSEEPGMAACASWLETFMPELPVHHISAGDPYWRPA